MKTSKRKKVERAINRACDQVFIQSLGEHTRKQLRHIIIAALEAYDADD